jgi:methylenetetrahydrofolate reductase (NADPH)
VTAPAFSRRRLHLHRSHLEPAALAAVEDMTYELVPLKSLEGQIEHLPTNARVSITASPAKTLEETLDICAWLLDLGHRPIPHLAARMVGDADHTKSIAARCKALGLTEVFCIAGDAEVPGNYADAMEFLREFLDVAAGDITRVGVGCYPDGHAFIPRESLREALAEKQQLFAEAGVAGHASTQMCFSTEAIRSWLEGERADGLELPVHLGVPGVVDRSRLLNMGMRLGVGNSLRYLKKNRSGLIRLFASSGYNPSNLIDPLAKDFERLRITGLHTFTFNQVEATHAWQRSAVG